MGQNMFNYKCLKYHVLYMSNHQWSDQIVCSAKSHWLSVFLWLPDWSIVKSGYSILVSLSCCRNIHANSHVDCDMCQGMMVVLHQPGVQYTYREEPLAYLCFPCLGCAVPLCPGNSIIFNPHNPRGLSSTIDPSVEIYSVGMYLKTSIAGMNDTSLPLTDTQPYTKNNL